MRAFSHCFKNIIITLFLSLLFTNLALAESSLPKLFLFFGHDNVVLDESSYLEKLSNPCVSGAQVVYTWKDLEPEKDVYDFSKIEKDINFLKSLYKKLFIQLQDRSFQPNLIYVPDYIKNDPVYHGGVAMQYDFPGEGQPITEGWVARVWDKAVQDRFQLLIKKLAEKFDGEIYGINLPETAVDFDTNSPPEGFSYDKYFYAELENLAALRKSFHQSIVMQYVNFFPGEWNNDHHYIGKLFSFALRNKIGLGGPDSVPYRKGQMKNSYPFFHKNMGEIYAVGMGIQEPDYTYKDPQTGTYYQFSDFYSFTKNYLGATILFWNIQEPFFSKQLRPALNNQNFFCRYENR